jgi:hypothetical protein
VSENEDRYTWKREESCPTCGMTDKTRIVRVFNGNGERLIESGRDTAKYNKTAKQGCGCNRCGAAWHQECDIKREEYRVVKMIKEGDLYDKDTPDD